MKFKAIVLVAALLAVAALGLAAPASDASSGIEVTDGLGNEFSFDGPVDKIMTIGVGVTATAIRVGAIDKIVVSDSYSYKDSYELFDVLREKVDTGDIAAGGNIYSKGKTQLLTDIVDAAEPTKGNFDLERDAVFLTGSGTYTDSIAEFLEDKGFKNVLRWYSIEEYDDVIDFAKTVSLVCTGGIHDSVEQMEYMTELINDTVEENVQTKTKAFYVTISGGVFKVGNTGSLTTSMIVAAGGDAFTVDSSKAKPTYETSLTELIADNPGAIIFADSQITNNEANLADLQKLIGDTKVYSLKSIWNNYSIESMDGVWTMACAMYPDLFEGDVPDVPESKSNTMLYAAVGAVIVLVVCVAAYMFMKKTS